VNFTVKRPTQEQAAEDFASDKPLTSETIAKYITGWEGMMETFMLPDGDPEAEIPYDPEAVQEVMADHVDCWNDIAQGMVRLFTEQTKARYEDPKNSGLGLKDTT
jgi:hypothetical protein